jgi:hypothetical protein
MPTAHFKKRKKPPICLRGPFWRLNHAYSLYSTGNVVKLGAIEPQITKMPAVSERILADGFDVLK